MSAVKTQSGPGLSESLNQTLPEDPVSPESEFLPSSEYVVGPGRGGAPERHVRFGDDAWDVTPLKKKPSPKDKVVLRFDTVPPAWRLRVKELLFYCIHPNHPLLVRTGLSGRRKPVAPLTARGIFWSLRLIATWAEEFTPEPLANWGARDAEKFLAHIQATSGPSSNHSRVGAFRMLRSYSEVLTGGGMQVNPWPSHLSNSKIAGYKVSATSLRTAPMSPEVWSNNVSAAWRFVDSMADQILAARDAFESSSAKLPSPQNEEESLASVLSLTEYPVTFLGDDLEDGYHVNHRLVSQFALGRPDGIQSLRASAHAQIRLRAVNAEIYQDSAYEYSKRVGVDIEDSWISRQSYKMVADLQKNLLTACYIVIASFSMMRDSEIRGIGRDAVEDHYGIPAIRSTKFKRDSSGRDYHWWISDPVVRAIDVAERLTRREDHLFGSTSTGGSQLGQRFGPGTFNGFSISRFAEFVATFGSELGLPAMKLPLHARLLRRTMATIVGNAEDGQIALALQLKHATNYAVANALTSAYAEPDSRWAREVNGSRHAAAVEAIVDSWGRTTAGGAFGGPGSDSLTSVLRGAEDGSPNIGDPQMLNRWLAGRFPQMRLGTFNHCLGDSSVAACLTPAARERGDVPDPMFCKPAHCKNSFVSDRQRVVVATELELVRDLHKRQHASPTTRRKLETRMHELERMAEDPDDSAS